MAEGDVTVFDEALKWMGDGTFDLDGGTWKLAILDNTTTPAVGDTTPTLADYTEVGTAGNYVAGGATLTLTWTEAAGVVTLDETTNPSYAANGLNDTDAYWGLVYQTGASNGTTDAALCFVDLGGPKNMATSIVGVTWGANGILTHQRS